MYYLPNIIRLDTLPRTKWESSIILGSVLNKSKLKCKSFKHIAQTKKIRKVSNWYFLVYNIDLHLTYTNTYTIHNYFTVTNISMRVFNYSKFCSTMLCALLYINFCFVMQSVLFCIDIRFVMFSNITEIWKRFVGM